jgi:ArsR family transcriptional regulator
MSNYSNKVKKHAEMFKALGNPHRLEIFLQLTRCCTPGTVCNLDEALSINVGDIGKMLDIAPSTVSHHLKELHRANLIEMRRNGKNIECWIEPKTLKVLSNFFSINELSGVNNE